MIFPALPMFVVDNGSDAAQNLKFCAFISVFNEEHYRHRELKSHSVSPRGASCTPSARTLQLAHFRESIRLPQSVPIKDNGRTITYLTQVQLKDNLIDVRVLIAWKFRPRNDSLSLINFCPTCPSEAYVIFPLDVASWFRLTGV